MRKLSDLEYWLVIDNPCLQQDDRRELDGEDWNWLIHQYNTFYLNKKQDIIKDRPHVWNVMRALYLDLKSNPRQIVKPDYLELATEAYFKAENAKMEAEEFFQKQKQSIAPIKR